MRKPALLTWGVACATALAAVACSEPPIDQGQPRGGWDGNSGNYNGNIGSFGTVSGLPAIPTFTDDPTGPGTANNAVVYGLRYAPPNLSPCARATSGVVDVRFLSSTGSRAAAIGPDVEVEHTGGGVARLTMGETVVFPGRVHDGYMRSVEVMLEVRRVDTLVYRNQPWYQWPVFALRLCENGNASANLDAPPWKHMGFVSWAPFVRLPETDAESLQWSDSLVQAVTTIPRAEYRDNPNVPPVVAAQSGALLFKFAFFSGAPVALHREAALDLRSTFGASIPNAEFIFRGAMALGNASWVTLKPEEDPAQHKFLSFFTRDGTEVAMFSLARGNDAVAGEIQLPMSWGDDLLEPLRLTSDETTTEAADCLDNVQAMIPGTLPGGQRIAATPTHGTSGPSTFRSGLYLNSPNNRKYWYYSRLRANVAATRLGTIVGPVPSQVALELHMRAASGPVAFLVAAESPLPLGTQPFEQQTNIDPPPPDAPIIPPVQPIDAAVIDAPTDAGIDAPTDAQDAGVDAPTDAQDAGVDAPLPPIDAPEDAGLDAPLPPIDAPIDAGMDAPLPPIDAPIDAGMDAPLPPIDAPLDAPEDAMDANDADVDADESCAVGCDGGGPG